ncbi:M56 family metallopeptidase [Chryseobacterium sp. 09-1422]|uniref:M56 family metallopeptidase n=1 Tax=Chryseobacterium kimseyorum TaxID=2984028 RepID=A0ABT3I0F0_9FLAO|nr:M56 family metallopeptidase [Chryseobacterium kimseyorum]MCW3169415.1 M56 family metallopeptidase [Chryseobacterium kimseyorum]
METIILKTILCSAIVLGLYYLFLAKEKTFTFNRFYLLLGLIFSYSIPFLTIETEEIVKEKPTLVMEQEIPTQVLQNPILTQEETFDYSQFLLIIYFVISGIMILKMLYSVVKIKTLKGRKIIYKSRNVILLEKNIAPFTFLNTIYLSEKSFKDNKIDGRIFLHEEIHVKQKHSLDVLFIETVKAFSWFNPFIYLYKNMMTTNHEFLADEEVIKQKENIKNYQELILNEVLKQQNLPLTHQFHFNNTKKRFIMMTKRNSKFAEAKKYLAIPIFAVLAISFAERVYANDNNTFSKDLSLAQPLKVSKTYSSDTVKEFLEITNKYKTIIAEKDYERFYTEVPRAEQVKLIELFNQIHAKDLSNVPLWIWYDEILKAIPSQKQLNQFLDSKYKIILNRKVVDNSTLKNYKNTDFYHVYILKVFPKNPDFGKFEYSVTLFTSDYAKKFNNQKNIVISFSGSRQEYLEELRKDTIIPKKNIDVKLSELNSAGTEFNNDKKVQDLAIAPAVSVTQDVTTLPEYPGGVNAMRIKVTQHFSSAALKGDEGTVKTNILFTISEKGEVSNIRSTGNNEVFNTEAIRAVKLANENVTWKPATKDGSNVAYLFRLPLTMMFENFKKTQ